MTRVAVVDLGSNSTRLLIADIGGDDVELLELDRQLTITRLGESVDSLGELQPTAINRVRSALENYMSCLEARRADCSVAVATSAVRDARNGRDFLDAVEQEFGIQTELLSGQREAALAFRGATLGRKGQRATLLVDIGGGSTEYVLGSSGEIDFSRSLDLGCVRLTERFLEHDPPTGSELNDCRSYVRSTLSEGLGRQASDPKDSATRYGQCLRAHDPAASGGKRLAEPGFARREPPPARGAGAEGGSAAGERARPESAVGVAGTVTTLAMLSLGLDSELPDLIHGHQLSRPWLEDEVERLGNSPVSELRARPGIHPDRAPVIVAGALVLVETLDHFDLEGIEVSENDLLHGVALSLVERF